MEPAILTVIIIVLIIIVLALLIVLVVSSLSGRRDSAGQAAGIGLLQQQLEALKAAQDIMRENLNKSLQTGQSNISTTLQTSQQVLDRLKQQIGELQGTNKQMLQVGSEVRKLQDILSGPKVRGQLGEWSLKNLLENVLPADTYELQYTFRDGKIVDALIKLADTNVPIDAKFPLPSFERLLNATCDEEKEKLRRQFQRDIIIHIDKISSSYIKPDQGTLDFAFMFIPAENVYYETIVRYQADTKDILQYSFDKKVIPVSPNLLYAYLMTIAMGLHGMQVEKQAEQILQNIKKLNSSFAGFSQDWEVLGTHLRNSYNKYEDGQKKLDRFGLHLENISEESSEKIETVK